MRITILPKTSLGRWSVGLAAAIILVIVWNIVSLSQKVLEFNNGSVELRIFFVAHCIFGIGSLVTGLISIIRRKERSILGFLALVVGLYTLLFIYLFITEGQW
jgi:glucan phosphoethanolaminetransferase (alkaline phosphatase superfamily)